MIHVQASARIALAASILGLVGCAGVVHDLGENGGQGATTGVVRWLNEPRNQRALADVASSPAVQMASQDLGTGLGQGLAEELIAVGTGQTPPTVAGRWAEAAHSTAGTRPVARPGDLLAAYLHDTLDPAVAEMIRQSVDKGVREALGPRARDDARAMAESIGDGAIRGIFGGLRRDGGPVLDHFTTDQLGPAVGTIMSRQIRPVLKDFFDQDVAPTVIHILQESAADALKVPVRPDVQPDVVINAANVSKGAAFGSHEAAVDLGLLTKDGAVTTGARAFFWGLVTVVILAGLVAIAFLVVLTMLAFRLRRGPDAVRN